MLAASPGRQKRGGGLFQKTASGGGGDVMSAIEKPRDHAGDIRIKNWNGLIKRKSRDGGGGVGADAGKRAELAQFGWDLVLEIRRDRLGGLVEVARAGVVAEAFPVLQHGFLGGGGKGCHIGKAPHPPREIGQDGGDGRLLEHEFRNKHAVRRGVVAPRQ